MAGGSEAKGLVAPDKFKIVDLFQNRTFSLDYFQREYVWENEHVEKLVTDLTRKFLDQWSKEHSAGDVRNYDPYFLGTFIVYNVDRRTWLADGQQRIITLLLVLIFLRRSIVEPANSAAASLLSTLIVSERFGRRTFTVDVDEYASCFDDLLHGRKLDIDKAPRNVQLVWKAYQHIGVCFPPELRGEVLGMFVDWLLHRVSLVALDAGDRERAVEMFQSMNDRGVRLSPMDHLKRYLLGDAQTDPRELEGKWTAMVATLEGTQRDASLLYMRTIFRAKFPELAKRSEPSLTDATHEWVYAHRKEIWPNSKNGDRARLFTELLYPLHHTYAALLSARTTINPAFPAVRFNAFNGISEQFDLTFATLQPGDSLATKEKKAAIVANFLDLFYVTQMLDDEPVDQKAIDELVSEVITAAQLSRSDDDLRRALGVHVVDWPDRLKLMQDLRYDAKKRFVRYMLARLTAWIEVGAGKPDPTDSFLNRRPGDRGFEIEHLFTSNAAKYAHVVPDASYYGYLRNRIGALLLLDGLDNSSYGGMLLSDKLPHYRGDTALAGMLNTDFLERGRIRLQRFLKSHGLSSPTYDEKTAIEAFIEARCRFYYEIAKSIWSLDALQLTPPAGSNASPKRTSHGTRVSDLVNAGMINANDRLVGHRKRRPYYALVRGDGRIETANKKVSTSPTAAMMAALGISSNGWAFWHLERTNERLDVIRRRYLSHPG